MLKTFFKAISAKDLETLQKLSEEVYSASKESKPTRAAGHIKTGRNHILITQSITGILSVQALGKFGFSRFNEFSFFLTPFISNHFENASKPRAFCALIAGTFPIKQFSDTFLESIGIPVKFYTPATFLLYGALETASIKLTQNIKTNLIDFTLTSLSTAGLIYINSLIIESIHKLVPIIPYFAIYTAVSLLSAPILHRVCTFGLKSAIRFVIESIASLIFKEQNTHAEFLPQDIEIPESMQCTICHDLLNNPVECQGFFFCKKCLDEWLKVGSIHPANGLPISEETIVKNVTMNMITIKYRRIVFDQYRRDHPDWQPDPVIDEINEENTEEEQ